MFRSILLTSLLFFSPLAHGQIGSIISQVTSGAASVASDATSVAASLASVGTSGAASVGSVGASGAASVTSVATSGAASVATGVFETVTSVGGSAVTIITSAGGKAVTVGASGVTGAVGDITSVYQSATAAAHSNAALQYGALGVVSSPLCASVVTVLAGFLLGAWAIF